MKSSIKSVKKLWIKIQTYPETAALIVGIIFGAACFIALMCAMHGQKGILEMITLIIETFLLSFLCVGGLFFYMAVMIFSEKKMKDLNRAALDSGIKVMINQALIDSGAAKTKADLLT